MFRHERLEFSGQACLSSSIEGESPEVRVLKLCFKAIVCAASIETPPSAPMMERAWGGKGQGSQMQNFQLSSPSGPEVSLLLSIMTHDNRH